MPVCSTVKLLLLGTAGDLMHYCTRPSASCNNASGRPRHLGVIVWTILQTGMNNCLISFDFLTLAKTFSSHISTKLALRMHINLFHHDNLCCLDTKQFITIRFSYTDFGPKIDFENDLVANYLTFLSKIK